MRYASRLREKGFTLIELLVVIAIISLLTSIILASFATIRTSARDTGRVVSVNQIIIALELYKSDYGHYPCSSGQLSSSSDFLQALVDEGLLSTNPKDPFNSAPFIFYYQTFRMSASDLSCGDFAEIDYDMENSASQCISKGKEVTPDHCHVFIPTTLPLPCQPYMEIQPPTGLCAGLSD